MQDLTPFGRGIQAFIEIAERESGLGVRLFNRTMRRIHLTDEGVRYLAICKTALGQLDDAEEALFDTKAKLSGKLVITAPVLFVYVGSDSIYALYRV